MAITGYSINTIELVWNQISSHVTQRSHLLFALNYVLNYGSYAHSATVFKVSITHYKISIWEVINAFSKLCNTVSLFLISINIKLIGRIG